MTDSNSPHAVFPGNGNSKVSPQADVVGVCSRGAVTSDNTFVSYSSDDKEALLLANYLLNERCEGDILLMQTASLSRLQIR